MSTAEVSKRRERRSWGGTDTFWGRSAGQHVQVQLPEWFVCECVCLTVLVLSHTAYLLPSSAACLSVIMWQSGLWLTSAKEQKLGFSQCFRSDLLTTLLTACLLRDESALLTISLFLSLFSFFPFPERVVCPLTGCHWYGGWWVSSRGAMCADGNRWRFILEARCATSTLHVPFCLPIVVKASVAKPSSGGQMVPFGEGPQHSAPCSWGSTGATKNKHDLLLLGTYRTVSVRDLKRLWEWHLKNYACVSCASWVWY